MELELGLKITKTRDDFDFISKYEFNKDTEPVFQSRETNTMFILTAHLKGYKRNNIDIKISKDGNKISISGEKAIQEMVMMGWILQRKVVDVKGFNKVFKIPYGVNLDKIKANYNEEEWMLNIVMPKLVKGFCGLKIVELNEQERSEIHHVSSSVDKTSQKGSKDSKIQHIEKFIDDVNKEKNEETIKNEFEEYKLRTKDGNVIDDVNRDIVGSTTKKENKESKLKIEDSEVKDLRENDENEALKDVGKGISHNIVEQEKSEIDLVSSSVSEKRQRGSKYFEFQHMQGRENNIEKKLKDDSNKEINKDKIQKEVEEYNLRNEDENGECVRENDGKEEYEVMKNSELDQIVTLKKEKEESKLSSKDSKVKDIRENDGLFILHKFEDSSQDKEFEDQKLDSRSVEKRHDDANGDMFGIDCALAVRSELDSHRVDTRSKEKEESKLRLEDDSKVKDRSQRVFEKTVIHQSGESKQKEFEEPFGTKEKLKESIMEPFEQNVGDHNPSTIYSISQNEYGDSRIPQIKKTTSTKHEDVQKTRFGEEGNGRIKNEGNEGLKDRKTEETEIVKEEMLSKEVEYFVQKGEGEKHKKLHEEVKKGNKTTERMQEYEKEGIEKNGQQHAKEGIVKEMFEVSKSMNEELQHRVVDSDGSKGFDFANEAKQNEVIKDAFNESESLMEKMEGEESKERTKGIVQCEGSKKMHVEPKETFNGREAQKFQEIETHDFIEEGGNIENSMKKLNDYKYEKIQNEDESFKENITIEKDECKLQEEMSKETSHARKGEKQDLLDSLADTRKGLKGIKEESEKVKPFVKKVKGEQYERIQVETNEELEGSEIEKDPAMDIRTPEKDLPSYALVQSIGFKEFDYGNGTNKKQKTKLIIPEFQSKETHESKDDSANQDNLNPEKPKEVEENYTHNMENTKEVETIEEKGKLCEGNKEKNKGPLESKWDSPTKEVENLIEMKGNQENKRRENLKQEIYLEKKGKKGEKSGETMQEKNDEYKNKIDGREQLYFKEYKTAENVNVENSKIDDEITKCMDETMKTTHEKEHSIKDDVVEMKTKKPLEQGNIVMELKFPKTKDHKQVPELKNDEQHGYNNQGTEEIKAPKIEAFEGDKSSKSLSPRFNQQSTDDIIDYTNHKTIPMTEEKCSGSKRVEEKVHETQEREHERNSEVINSKKEVDSLTTFENTTTEKVEMKEPKKFTSQPNMNYEIPRVEEIRKEEGQKHIQVLEANICKGKDRVELKGEIEKQQVNQIPFPKEPFHSIEGTTPVEVDADKVVQNSKTQSSSCTQQSEGEGELKTKKTESEINVQELTKSKTCQEVEQCINKDEEAKNEKSGGKKENAKTSKKLCVPFIIAGSALLVTIVFIFVQHRRSRKSGG